MKPKNKSEPSRTKLRLENLKLRRRVAELEDKLGIELKKESEGSKADERFNELTGTYLSYKNRSYFSYIISQIKRTTLWNKTDRVVKYSRFYLFLSRTFKTFMAVTVWLQTSAAFLIVATAAVTLLPILFVLSTVALIFTLIYRNKYNRLLASEISERTITVFVATNDKIFKDGSYFKKMVSETAERDDRIVFVVTPYFWSLRGLGGRGVFACARQESENVWLLRNYYYFFFKRTALARYNSKTTYVY